VERDRKKGLKYAAGKRRLWWGLLNLGGGRTCDAKGNLPGVGGICRRNKVHLGFSRTQGGKGGKEEGWRFWGGKTSAQREREKILILVIGAGRVLREKSFAEPPVFGGKKKRFCPIVMKEKKWGDVTVLHVPTLSRHQGEDTLNEGKKRQQKFGRKWRNIKRRPGFTREGHFIKKSVQVPGKKE